MRPLLPALLLLLAPLALASHTPRGDCDGTGDPSLGLVQVSEGQGAYYVDARGDETRVYEETNGIWVAGDPAHSLQRGGSNAYIPDDSDPRECVDDPLLVPDARWL